MKNHFHLLVRIYDEDRLDKSHFVANSFKIFFISYAKAINKSYGRTGALFQRPFCRREVTADDYFARLIHCIHFNPQKHSFALDFRKYPFSSYNIILSDGPSIVEREKVLDWFDGKKNFIEFHNQMADERNLGPLIDEDD